MRLYGIWDWSVTCIRNNLKWFGMKWYRVREYTLCKTNFDRLWKNFGSALSPCALDYQRIMFKWIKFSRCTIFERYLQKPTAWQSCAKISGTSFNKITVQNARITAHHLNKLIVICVAQLQCTNDAQSSSYGAMDGKYPTPQRQRSRSKIPRRSAATCYPKAAVCTWDSSWESCAGYLMQ